MSHTSHEHIDRCLFFIRMYFYWLIYSLETLRLSIAMSSISRVVFIAVRRVQQIIRCSNLFNLSQTELYVHRHSVIISSMHSALV